jgi:hypothetical protein
VDARPDRWDEGVLAGWAVCSLSCAARRCACRARRHRMSKLAFHPLPICIRLIYFHLPNNRAAAAATQRRSIRRRARTRRAPAPPLALASYAGAATATVHAPSTTVRSLLPRICREGTCGARHQRVGRSSPRRARSARAHGFAGQVCSARAWRWGRWRLPALTRRW